MKRAIKARLRGFTLVELLIVVSIIGVLATIGVPTFRTMVQKAKKSEAKVGLGGLYTSETAFYSEYGAYGNVLDKIGFDSETSPATRTYSIGFLNATCGNLVGAASPNATSTVQGSAINVSFPGYYGGTQIDTYKAARAPLTCPLSVLTATGDDFTASAAGIIAPGSAALTDQWTITRLRVLVNNVDGVGK